MKPKVAPGHGASPGKSDRHTRSAPEPGATPGNRPTVEDIGELTKPLNEGVEFYLRCKEMADTRNTST